ncbi:hypothetical protein SAMN02927925_02632 [Flavobacterium saliperosum]|uniref:Uncharacterized protein n=2 Tax=Flavobacterium saliperosum TaxID=329186 RepID=A0A1G4W7R2_9FLAO|nr:hypothetical protein SAMN02927925_02632 [Flavobacterium saliperosum]
MALILTASIFIACSRDAETVDNLQNNFTNSPISFTNRTVSAKELSEDITFIELVDEMDSFSKFIKQTIDDKSLSIATIQTQLDHLQNQNLTYEEQLSEINAIFTTSVSNKLELNMKGFSEKWGVLKVKYENLDESTLAEAFNQVLDKRDHSGVGSVGPCGWRYNVYLGASYAAAVLCHAGCDTTALGTTAGLGIPACFMACGTLQVYAAVQCYDSYC